MAQVRSVSYTYMEDIPAAGTIELYQSGLLRDVLPDQAFDIVWMRASMVNEVGVNDTMMFEVAKNILPLAIAHGDSFITNHGHMWWIEEVHTLAENQLQFWHHQIVFYEPMDFDKNDSLNIRMQCINTGTATYIAHWVFTVGYRPR